MMRNRLIAGLILLALMLSLLIASCGKNDPVVVSIDDKETITLSELKMGVLKGRPEDQWKDFSELEVRAALDKMIEEKFKIMSAKEAGLEEDAEVLKRYQQRYANHLLQALYTKEIVGKVLPEEDIEDWYDRQGKQVHFSDIFIGFPSRRPTEAQSDSVKAIADSLYARIKAGEDFGYLAKLYSQDPESSNTEGKVGIVKWERDNDPVRKTLWAMKKQEISKPVSNNKGYHILRVEEIEALEQQPYEAERERIRGWMLMERRSKINERAEAYWEEITKKKNVLYDEEKISKWAAWFASMSPMAGVVKDSLANLSAEQLDEVLCSYEGGQYTLRFVQDKLQPFNKDVEFRLGEAAILKEFFLRDMQSKFLVEEAEKLGLHKKEPTKTILESLLYVEMVQVYLDRDVVGPIEVTPQDLDAYYEAVKEPKYKLEKQVKIQEILVKDKVLADQLMRQIRSGSDFGKLAEKYTERPQHKKVKGEFAWFPKGRWGKMGEKAFQMKKGEVAGPLYQESQGGYSIFKVIDLRPDRFRTKEDLKDRLERDYRLHIRRERILAFFAEQRAKRDIHIDDDVIKKNIGK